MSDTPHQLLTVPQWTLPALVALLAGTGVGYGGARSTATEPAVLAEGVTRVREDLGSLRQEVRDLTVEVRGLSAAQLPRAEHDQWVRSVYRPDHERLRVEVDRQRGELEALRLELRTPRKESPWTP